MSALIDVRETRGHRVPANAERFLDELEVPTVFHVPGHDRARSRVVAGLIHGNEPSGLRAIHRYLRSGEIPAVDAWLFVGNVASARTAPRFSHRMLPGRRDLNRCFRPPFRELDGQIAEHVLGMLREVRPELVVDLHNNTGRNPAYAVGGALDERLDLAALFCDRFVCSNLNLGTFTEAFTELAPSVTIECGRVGDPQADATAYAGLLRLMRTQALVSTYGREHMMILEEPVRVCLRPELSLAFGARADPRACVTLDLEIDRHNFEVVAEGTRFGWIARGVPWPFDARDESGAEVSARWLEISQEAIVSRRSFVPFMMTTHAEIARVDCLFYAATRRA
ncbi:MAG: succinylglutamate desuccinylase/aspartoacylase family protein [Kofleriaceae bacterium]|nr:succinylglutamate desuccinylase/aspartoacylase family protein [Kofleriaceae bacterium]